MVVPFTKDDLVNRLYEECRQHGALFIAFDFDNTIFDFHNTGRDFHGVIELLKACSEKGHKMILLTSNEDEDKLTFIHHYC